ncbi:helix-turn-helix domain-containing protein, partial [Moraxella catarrhalis]
DIKILVFYLNFGIINLSDSRQLFFEDKAMAVTQFGRAVRHARHHTNETLMTMAQALGVSVSFLSAVETGRSKVPNDLVVKISDFFSSKGYRFEENLEQLAQISNGSVAIDKLDYQHQMMVAGFASSTYSKEELDRICELLTKIQQARREAIDE